MYVCAFGWLKPDGKDFMNRRFFLFPALLAGVFAVAPLAMAQSDAPGTGRAVITVLPKNDKQPTADVSQQAIKVEVNGKPTTISNWQPLRGSQSNIELVILIDSGARSSLGSQMGELQHFVTSLPPSVKAAFAYMQNGRALLAGPLTANHALAVQGLHLPIGQPGSSASPYFCLSDLAKRWPSNDLHAAREVLMITDGVDQYERRYDPDDPYVQAAINDSARAHLVVYSIYWLSNGRADRSGYENNAGQNLLLQVDQATGGKSYWQGMGNPVTFAPYFEDLNRRFNNQYEMQFTAPIKNKAEIASLKVKTTDSKVKVDAPQRVLIAPQGAAPE